MAMPAAPVEELARDRNSMAVMRTLMGADRTLMAWVRTSLSLLSFGFTIYKVLEGIQEATKSWPRGRTPQDAGLILTLMGTLAMVMGTIEYWQTLKLTRRFKDIRLTRFPMVMAVVMSLAGIVLFLTIATRVF
jgi:putative membrane protein